MDFDFNLILVPITLLLVGVMLYDRLKLKQRKTLGKGNEHTIINIAHEYWPIFAVVLVVRSFIVEPFKIPSESMLPTMQTGDYIAVNKFAYGLRLPILNNTMIPIGEPKHGDVMVFKFPVNPSINYIKRVVGVPGDTIEFNKGTLYINSVAVPSVRVQQDTAEAQEILLKETLGTKTHIARLLDGAVSPPASEPDGSVPFVYAQTTKQGATPIEGSYWKVSVPQGHYFMMGDNRDNSQDSRFWGFVPEKNIVCRADYVWMHKVKFLELPSFSRNGPV